MTTNTRKRKKVLRNCGQHCCKQSESLHFQPCLKMKLVILTTIGLRHWFVNDKLLFTIIIFVILMSGIYINKIIQVTLYINFPASKSGNETRPILGLSIGHRVTFFCAYWTRQSDSPWFGLGLTTLGLGRFSTESRLISDLTINAQYKEGAWWLTVK